jgi:O-antigen ligase
MNGVRETLSSFLAPSRITPLLLLCLPILAAINQGVFASAFILIVTLTFVNHVYLSPTGHGWFPRSLLPIVIGVLAIMTVMGLDVVSGYFKEVVIVFVFIATLDFCRKDIGVTGRGTTPWVFIGSVFSIPLVALLYTLLFDPCAIDVDTFSLIGNHGNKKLYLFVAWACIAAYVLYDRGMRKSGVACMVLTGLFAAASYALTALAAFLVAGAILVTAFQKPRLARFGVLMIPILPVVLSALYRHVLPEDLFSEWLPRSFGVRLELWSAAVRVFIGQPILGGGFDSFGGQLSAIKDGSYHYLGAHGHPHSWLLHILTETGLLGGAIAVFGLVRLTDPQCYGERPYPWVLAALAASLTCLSISLSAWSDFSIALLLSPVLAFKWISAAYRS